MGLGGWFRTIRCEIHTHARYLEYSLGNRLHPGIWKNALHQCKDRGTVRNPLPCSWNRRFEFLFPAIKNSLLPQRETKRWRVFAIFTRELGGCVFLSSGGSIHVPVCSGSGGIYWSKDANNKKCHISLSCLHLCPKIKSNMKIIEGTFVSAEDIITELRVFGNVWRFFLPGRLLNPVLSSGQARQLLPSVTIRVNRPFADYWQKPWVQVMSGWFVRMAECRSIMLPNLTLSWRLFFFPPTNKLKISEKRRRYPRTYESVGSVMHSGQRRNLLRERCSKNAPPSLDPPQTDSCNGAWSG